jgi:hypothetical protein
MNTAEGAAMTAKPITGGCQCGAVRYRLNGRLLEPGICHCRMCQKATGGLFMAMVGSMNDDLELTRDAPAWFNSSDVFRRGFCASCGTPLFYQKQGGKGTGVSLGSLDDPAAVKPVAAHGVQSRMPWLAEACRLDGTTTTVEFADAPGMVMEIDTSNHQHPDHDTVDWTPHRG